MHIPARLREAGMEAGTPDADARMVELVRKCLDAHGGEFDPSWISRKQMGFQPGDEPVYSMFNKLLVRGGLKAFIQMHPEFSWSSKGTKGMTITWAPEAPSSASASGAASATQAAVGAASGRQWAPSSATATGAAASTGAAAGSFQKID